MTRKDPKQIVLEMVKAIGRKKAKQLLEDEDISRSLAVKLVRGTYPNKIRSALVISAINRAREQVSKAS